MFIMKLNRFDLFGFILLLGLLFLLAISLDITLKDFRNFDFSPKILIEDIFVSYLRVFVMTFCAWISGIICGLLFHQNRILHKLFMPSINFVRHISPFAWLPFAIVWFGLGEMPVAFIMFITLFFPTLISAIDQFQNIPPDFIDEAKVSGANMLQMCLYVKLPLTFSGLINLLRIIWGLGWATIIAAEMLGVQSGLGFRLLDFRYLLQYSKMLYYLIVMGILGIITDLIFRYFQNRLNTAISS